MAVRVFGLKKKETADHRKDKRENQDRKAWQGKGEKGNRRERERRKETREEASEKEGWKQEKKDQRKGWFSSAQRSGSAWRCLIYWCRQSETWFENLRDPFSKLSWDKIPMPGRHQWMFSFGVGFWDWREEKVTLGRFRSNRFQSTASYGNRKPGAGWGETRSQVEGKFVVCTVN